ncbi:MAG: thioredoxin domain-containing protein [Candidatus Lokiarchaeota archaeon]|nr:thioredoxin domain-containing protein [Candidatus Lokiarchaeota archaeon]
MNAKNEKNSNRLINEKSPYLLQHAYDSVDWYPWGEDAFEKARKENKPIFLSIGYSTCHWCHVMHSKSFSNEIIANLLNETFVSIKVDREERPDIDNIYMQVCQMMTGSGGWPLSIIMNFEKKPFFAATYIPPEQMMALIPHIKELWKSKQYEVMNAADEVILNLRLQIREQKGENLNEELLKVTYDQLSKKFDSKNGGFSLAPKFPTPHNLLFLLRYWKRYKDEKALFMVEHTLEKMRQGGIYDHIGFGFARYSTDPYWLVPHFEKMLYDQALMALVYIEAYQITKKKEYEKIAREIFTYVMRDMTSPEGGFYSAEDADSEGEEGKFYLWSLNELHDILDEEELNLVKRIFNVQESGNFIEQIEGEKNGLNIIHLTKPLKELELVSDKINRIRNKLFDIREKRVHPGKDDKILTDWNGLMISVFALGSIIFKDYKLAKVAEKAANFILDNLKNTNGKLLHRFKDGDASIPAMIDDYAFLIWGLLELYEANYNTFYLREAFELNKVMINHFWDQENGGFFFTADDNEELLVRKKEAYDGAIPSGNSVAMLNLLRLGTINGDLELIRKADELGKVFSNQLRNNPSSHTFFMIALDYKIGPSYLVVIAGKKNAPDTNEMLDALISRFIPNKFIILNLLDEENFELTKISEIIQNQIPIDGKATAYICFNYTCKDPTIDIERMLELMSEN